MYGPDDVVEAGINLLPIRREEAEDAAENDQHGVDAHETVLRQHIAFDVEHLEVGGQVFVLRQREMVVFGQRELVLVHFFELALNGFHIR